MKPTRQRPPIQFGIGALLLLTAIMGVVAAGLAMALQSYKTAGSPGAYAVLLLVIAPLAIVVFLNLLAPVSRLLQRGYERLFPSSKSDDD